MKVFKQTKIIVYYNQKEQDFFISNNYNFYQHNLYKYKPRLTHYNSNLNLYHINLILIIKYNFYLIK